MRHGEVGVGACLWGHIGVILRWLSKLWSLFGYPNRDPKKDRNFDNHLYEDNGKEHGNYNNGFRV